MGLRKTLVTKLSISFGNTPDCTKYLIFKKDLSGELSYTPNSTPIHTVLLLLPFPVLFLPLGHFHSRVL